MSPRTAFADTFRSLRIRNYRLFTIAQVVSITGTWMQTVAQSLLVLRLTHSGVALGVVVGLQFLPTAFAGMWFGLHADRFDKRKILIWTQSLSGALALALGLLTMTGSVRLWMVYVLALLLGGVTAADTPARQAFVIEMVGKKEVANAVGLNSAVFNAGRIIGPALAALVIKVWGIPIAFIFNAISYVFPVVALVMMNLGDLRPSVSPPRERNMLRQGFAYGWKTRPVRRVLVMMAVIATIAFNYTVTVPLLALYTFHGNEGTYAWLLSLTAAGGMAGAVWTAHRARPTQRLLAVSAFLFGAFMLAVAFAPNVLVAGILLIATGAASMAFITTANTTLQLETPAHLRGRIMALYALVFLGSTPIGAPIVGWISHEWGARAGFGVGAVCTLAAATVAVVTLGGKRAPALGPTEEALASSLGSGLAPGLALDSVHGERSALTTSSELSPHLAAVSRHVDREASTPGH